MRFTALLLSAVFMTTALSGCSATAMKRKFVRDKKQEEVRPQMYDSTEFVKTHSNSYYYSNHFTLCRSALQDLIKYAEGNDKTRNRAREQAEYHMQEMINLIADDEVAAGLIEHGEKLRWAADRLDSFGEDARAVLTLEKVLRRVNSEYAPSDMDAFIRTDDIQL